MLNLWNIMMNPLDQFVVRPIWGNFKLGINTFTLDTLLCAGVTFWLFYLLVLSNKNLSHFYTYTVGFALKTLSYGAVVGSKRYRPLYVFVFVLIAMSNVMGMIPFSLTSTSFAVMTFFAGITMFTGIGIIALASYNWKFVNLFLPPGAPLVIAPFLIVIETISYFARVMSLSIRLFANLLAGHALMKIIGTFVWSAPLLAAGLVNSLRPVADTSMGAVESFKVLSTQLTNSWNEVMFEASDLIGKADFWLFQNGIDTSVGVASAINAITAYAATHLAVFAAVGSLLFVFAHYFADELVKPLNEILGVSKNSGISKLFNFFYGVRAWVLSVANASKALSFDTKRQAGVWGLLVYTLSTIKYSALTSFNAVFSYFSRGTTVASRVTLKDVLSWNTYVAPVFVSSLWWVVAASVLTCKFVNVVNFISYAHFAQLSFSWGDVFSGSGVWVFGIFGSGIILATILSVLALGDAVWSMFCKAAPSSGGKLSYVLNGSVSAWTDSLAAVVVGLFAGWLQVSLYYMLFDISIASQFVPDSLVFGALTRVGHFAFPYVILFSILAYIFTMAAELITKSMDATETRLHMKWLWNVGPVLLLGLILAELLYWSLAFDLLGGALLESSWISTATTTAVAKNASEAVDLFNLFRSFNASNMTWQIYMWDRLWGVLAAEGVNPMVSVLGAIGGWAYVLLASLGNALSALVYYLLTEVDAMIIAGLSSLISLVALITLPLITPLAWAFLLAITFLEMVIAFLQAYVFITLSSMYLNDVIKLH